MGALCASHILCLPANSSSSIPTLATHRAQDVGYGSNKKMCQAYHGPNAIPIPFEENFLPLLQKDGITSSVLCNTFLSALDASVRDIIKTRGRASIAGSLLIVDHITSNTALQLPIDSIARYAKEEYGMIVCVDGAHGLLALPLDMGSILSTGNCQLPKEGGHVDIYLTNAHKWFIKIVICCPLFPFMVMKRAH